MIKIVSDSASLYSKKEALANDMAVSSLAVTINNQTYQEYEEIDTKTFIDIINQGHVPTSSQPSIGEVLDMYDTYSDQEIINICIADGLSGTYNSACMAKDMTTNPERIHVINSRTICGPQRYLVDLAHTLAKQNKSAQEIINEIESAMNHTKSYLIPNDFDYLVRGGRLSPLVGKIGTLIKLVPVTMLTEDGRSIDKFTTTRGFKKAIQKVAQNMMEQGVDSSYKLYISHALREDLALEAKTIIEECIPGTKVDIKLLGPAFTTQGGPGCVAIQYIKKHPALN